MLYQICASIERGHLVEEYLKENLETGPAWIEVLCYDDNLAHD